MVVEGSQGRLPERGDVSVEKSSRSWLVKGGKKAIPWEENNISKGQEARYSVVRLCTVLGFGEGTLFHRSGCYHPLGSLSTSDQSRTE